MRWIPRERLEARVAAALRNYPITLLTGPRQCGKTTLAQRISANRRGDYFDLEDPETPLRPEAAAAILKDLRGLVVIDEIQRQPRLFELLRVLADRRPTRARFLILGSASPALVRGVSESLAGRVAYVDMGGFVLEEVGARNWKRLWTRGGLPAAYLAPTDAGSHDWRMHFIQSFLERDMPQLGIRVPAPALRRFWTMLAHCHAQPWNAADLARAMGVKEDTARHYLDILAGAFMVRQLMPWFENVGKRVVKSPKVYFRDSGLLHSLLGLTTAHEVLGHPRFGFSWEGFAMEHVLRTVQGERAAYFYRTHAGAELDLLILRRGKRYGFEFKFEDAPRVTRSMRVALQDLGLEHLWVVYSGERALPLADRISTLPLQAVHELAPTFQPSRSRPRG
ncbi:MAG: ATP-binding protein [Planctomycetota bacterium]